MIREELEEYLKQVDELEQKLEGQDKKTLQWLIYGYNECAKLLNKKEKVIKEAIEFTKEHIYQVGGDKDFEYLLEILERIDK